MPARESTSFHREYWERNIEGFGSVYSGDSEEDFDAPPWLAVPYRQLILPIERSLMTRRRKVTSRFLRDHIGPGLVATDVGCGNGIFTVEMLRRGAHVLAVDFSRRALELTRARVEALAPDRARDVEYIDLDVSRSRVPESDVTLAMGLTPYVSDLDAIVRNVLEPTGVSLCLYVDRDHPANRLRSLFPTLNVRRMHLFERRVVRDRLRASGIELVERRSFATGWLDLAIRGSR